MSTQATLKIQAAPTGPTAPVVPPTTEAPKAPETPQTPPVTPPTPEAPAAPVTPPPAVDIKKYQTEFETSGAISETSYKELSDKGIPKEMVDAYVANAKASQTAATTEVLSVVGGQDSYNKIAEWAGKGGLQAGEIGAFNAVLATNDPNQIKLAMSGLKAKYDAAFGTRPNLLSGTANNTAASFESWAQVTAAMADPKYKNDPAYRQKVQDRLAASTI